MTLIFLTPFALPIVFALVPGWWDMGLNWLIDHHVLVAAADAPLVMMPGDVAGIDGRRLVIVAAVLIAVTVCSVSWARLIQQRRVDRRLQSGDRL